MKKIKIFSAILTAMIIIFSNSVVAYAAPQTMPDGTVFDAEYYAANNPDVATVFGTDVTALYNHYKTYGIIEGRLPYDGATAPAVKKSNVTENLAQARIKYGENENIVKVIDYLNTIVDDSMTEREIVTIFHDEICNKTEYGETDNPFSGDIICDFENFKNGTARTVCAGYTQNFMIMCLLSGIRVQRVSGDAGGPHAWNRVLLDGVWYDIDVTWDDGLSNKEYFLVPAGTGVFADRTIGYGSPAEGFLILNIPGPNIPGIRTIPAEQVTDYEKAKEKIKTVYDRL